MSNKDYNAGLDTAASIVEEMLGGTSEGETLLCGIESSKQQSEVKNMKQSHNITRTYYYDFSDANGPVPDHENMIAFLLDESILFVGNDYGSGTITLYININDFFGPGSDAEPLPLNDIPKLFDLYKTKGYDGVSEYVAFKRGIENIGWRDKLKDKND